MNLYLQPVRFRFAHLARRINLRFSAFKILPDYLELVLQAPTAISAASFDHDVERLHALIGKVRRHDQPTRVEADN